jgi:hypothetical protein
LGRIGDARAVEPLITALKDKDSACRRRAAGALGRIGDARAVEPLIAVLKGKNAKVRGNASDALVRIGAPAVEPLLGIALKKDEYPNIRGAASIALRSLGDTRAVNALNAAIKDVDRMHITSNMQQYSKAIFALIKFNYDLLSKQTGHGNVLLKDRKGFFESLYTHENLVAANFEYLHQVEDLLSSPDYANARRYYSRKAWMRTGIAQVEEEAEDERP